MQMLLFEDKIIIGMYAKPNFQKKNKKLFGVKLDAAPVVYKGWV